MAPIIHLVRHAEGHHNLCEENEQLPDPELTPRGEEQCRALRERFPDHDKITHLVASPFRRTTQTCLLSFEPVVERGKTIIALPDAQEISLQPCDMGSHLSKIKAEFGDRVDYSGVPEDWHDKSPASKYEPTAEKLEARARDVRIWLRDLARQYGDDAQIVLVSHGGVIHFITQDWEGIKPGRGTAWENTDLRSYEFKDPTFEDPDAALQETKASWASRRGSAVPLTAAEHRQLQAVFQKKFEADLKRNAQKKAETQQ